MKIKAFLPVICVALLSCQKQQSLPNDSTIKTVAESNASPTIDIRNYNLILNSNTDRKADAEHILNLKRKWPKVMQSPNFIGFDSILSKDFTFVDNGHLFNREDYIKNRLQASDWKITYVKYENLSLQFFGDIALLTYRNHVKNENAKTGGIETEHINWSDIYAKEDGKWKIRSAHVIDIKIDKE